MMRRFSLASVLCVLAVCFACFGGLLTAASDTAAGPFGLSRAWAFEQKPAHFVVLDRTGRIGRSEMDGLLTMVKMDYNRPRFALQVNAAEAVSPVEAMLRQSPRPDKEQMAAAAKEAARRFWSSSWSSAWTCGAWRPCRPPIGKTRT